MAGTEYARAHRIDADEVTRVDGTLDAPDYADAFAVETAAAGRSVAELWARTCFERAPAPMRGFLVTGWRMVLGMDLGPRPSPDHVLGWRIVRATPDEVVLGARSAALGPVRLVVRRESERVILGTTLRYERPGAAVIWSVVGLIHRQVLPNLLTRAANNQA